MKTHRTLFSIACTVFLSVGLFAQSAEPAVPAVPLPDMDSEVNAVLPGLPEVPPPPLPTLTAPDTAPELPQAGQVRIPESAYRTEPAAQADAANQQARTLTETLAGAGLWNAIQARLSVYRPYDKASLNLDFSHDAMDGFAFHDAGQGFHLRDTAISGRMRAFLGSRSAWALSASFRDAAHGLQGQSPDFFGVNHRYLDVAGSWEHPLGPLGFTLGLELQHTDRSLELRDASPDPGVLGFQELTLNPSIALEWKTRSLAIGFDAAYGLRALLGLSAGDAPAERIAHLVSTLLRLDYDNYGALALGGKVGWAWSSSLGHLVPFEVSSELGLWTWGALFAEGGLAVEQRSLREAWQDCPWLDIGDSLQQDDGRWFAKGRLELYPAQAFTLDLAVSWARSLSGSGRLVPTAPASANRRLFGFTVQEYELLDSELGLRWRMDGEALGSLTLGAAWKAAWLDPSVLGESQFVGASLEYASPGEVAGASASVDLAVGSAGLGVPLVDAGAFVRLSPDFSLVVELRDILMAFQGAAGRVRWTPYLEEGFEATASLKLAL